MELTPFTWLALIIALIVGLLAGRFRFPRCPEVVFPGEIRDVPASGGTITLKDIDGHDYVIEVPQQKFPVGLTFRSSDPRRLRFPNPTGERIYRTFIKVTVTDEHGRNVVRFDPAIKTTMTYVTMDLDAAKRYLEQDMGDPGHKDDPKVRAVKENPKLIDDPDFLARLLVLFSNNGERWNRLAMLPGSRDTKAMTLTGYIASFSGSGCGGDH